MNACILKISLRSYWHAGSGRGGGAVIDATVHRDSSDLPVLPGRHLKGLLREAVRKAESFGWIGYVGVADRLFGTRPEDGSPLTESGCLRVSDAMLPHEVGNWLAGADGGGLVPHLFRNVYATAVEPESGTAVDKSLRGMQVVVPLDLCARIEIIPGIDPVEGWPDKLRGALQLIDAVGAHRTRGLGRAELTLEDA